MKSRFIPVLAAGLISASPAFAVIIDFDTPTSFASIDQHYNGGTDSAGVAGSNLGVSFGLDALAVQNDVLGPYFSNAPSPVGVMAPVGAAAAMNFLRGAGFNEEVSFYYSASAATSVNVWSDYDGTGTLLGSFSLAANAQSGCADSPFCHWDLASIDLGDSVLGRSITFGDAANVAGFDNVTLTAVPEPGSLALLAFGLAGLGASKRRAGRVATRTPAAA